MARNYKSLPELQDAVEQKLQHYYAVGTNLLNEEGMTVYSSYLILSQSFCFCEDRADFLQGMRDEIYRLRTTTAHSDSVSSRYKGVADKLAGYVRHNFEPELWENIPEFQKRREGAT